jgi:NhaP-type Na+/H+ or K+/H+ antiporter
MHFTDKLGIPWTPVMFVLGIVIGCSSIAEHMVISEYWMKMDPEFLLALFLPALIFESASNVDYHTFKM